MSNELPEPEKHFVWKKFVKFSVGESMLVTPNGDPGVFDQPMDLLFGSEQLAHDALVNYELVEQALEEQWILCVHEITPISFVIETLIPKE